MNDPQISIQNNLKWVNHLPHSWHIAIHFNILLTFQTFYLRIYGDVSSSSPNTCWTMDDLNIKQSLELYLIDY